ncbi:hypothetical protein [Kingella potus]|nr:hypothetical protein [Kingella potus]
MERKEKAGRLNGKQQRLIETMDLGRLKNLNSVSDGLFTFSGSF